MSKFNDDRPYFTIGTDAGGSGAAAGLEPDLKVFPRIARFKKGNAGAINMFRIWRNYHPRMLVRGFLERIDFRPGMKNQFPKGRNYQFAIDLFEFNDIPFEFVESKTWQFEFGLGGKHAPRGSSFEEEYAARKKAHQRKAAELFRNCEVTLDKADALLIALYGWRKLHGELTHGKTTGSLILPGHPLYGL